MINNNCMLLSFLAFFAGNAEHPTDHSSLRRRLTGDVCDESTWQDVDHGLVCGDCKVLADNFASRYGSCEEYCSAQGRQCTGAWEEVNDTCQVLYTMSCTDTGLSSSDAICECGADASAAVGAICGVGTCTDAVLDAMAGAYSCRARIDWLQSSAGMTEAAACTQVAHTEYPTECGGCNPAGASPTPGATAPAPTPAPTGGPYNCDEAAWPDKDHGLVCGECKVLVDNFSSVYGTCDSYCQNLGRQCTGAWEEVNDNCSVLHDLQCSQTLGSSDAICECGVPMGVPLPTPPPSPTPPPVNPGHVVKAMSFNLYGWSAFPSASRTTSMMDLIKNQDPDVYGAQELFGRTSLVATRTGLTAARWEEHGLNIFYNHQTVELRAQGSFHLVEQDQWGQRVVVWARFTHKASGNGFYYYNTHWCVCSENSLFGSAQTSAQGVANRSQPSLPALFGGDLNVFGGKDDSKALRYLTGSNVDGKTTPVAFHDTFLEAGGLKNNHGGPGTHGSNRIDFILSTQAGWSVVSGKVLPKESGSDHNGVTAEVTFV